MVAGFQTFSAHGPLEIERVSSLILGIGKGKTETLNRLALDDIHDGRSIVFIGKTAPVLNRIPLKHQKRTLYINPNESPFALNFLNRVPKTLQPQFALSATNALVQRGMTVYREYTFRTYFRYGLQTLQQIPGATLIHLKRLLTDEDYRHKVIRKVDDPVLKDFWNDYDKLPEKDQRTAIESTLALLYDFMLNPEALHCLFQISNKLAFKDKIVLIEDVGQEFVSLILAKLSTEDVETTIYIDDAKPYRSVIPMLKQPVFFSLRHIDEELLSHVSQVIGFRTSAKDARVIAKEMRVLESETALHELPDFTAYVRQGDRARELSMPLVHYPETEEARKIRKRCISQCTQPKDKTEERLINFF